MARTHNFRNILRIAVVTFCFCGLISFDTVAASSAAGTETLVGIVGKDFVLLGADSSVSQSIALTASNLDKIAHLVDPFPETLDYDENDSNSSNGKTRSSFAQSQFQERWKGRRRQQTILAAAAGDAADSDRLLGYLKAIGSLEEYKNGGMGCDVRCVSLDTTVTTSTALDLAGGLDARSMAHLARRCIWERLRSRTPYRICLLVAGMLLDDEHGERPGSSLEDNLDGFAFLSQRVQNQVQQATRESSKDTVPTISNKKRNIHNGTETIYRPSLFWLDEYGSLQAIEYGAHGHGSNFLLSILDQHYRPDLTRSQALALMKECFRELRSRYVINSPYEKPCIKCVDVHGVRVL